MKPKDVAVWLAHGAAVTLGGLLATEAYTKLRDPYVRAKIKNKFKRIKDELKEKRETA